MLGKRPWPDHISCGLTYTAILRNQSEKRRFIAGTRVFYVSNKSANSELTTNLLPMNSICSYLTVRSASAIRSADKIVYISNFETNAGHKLQ